MTIVTKINRDAFLRTKNRFYQCGWLDAERGERCQVDLEFGKSKEQCDYLNGYDESMDNSYAQEGC